MRVARNDDQLQITVSRFESRLLRRVFSALIENYRIKPDQMDGQAAQAWYSTRGCVTAKMSTDETREWLEHLHSVKSARRRLLEQLAGQLAGRRDQERQLCLKLEEGPELLTALNDHRLLLAAQHDLSQTEMDLRLLEDFEKLLPVRRTALWEIHLLAQLIEELLFYISPEAASWMQG